MVARANVVKNVPSQLAVAFVVYVWLQATHVRNAVTAAAGLLDVTNVLRHVIHASIRAVNKLVHALAHAVNVLAHVANTPVWVLAHALNVFLHVVAYSCAFLMENGFVNCCSCVDIFEDTILLTLMLHVITFKFIEVYVNHYE